MPTDSLDQVGQLLVALAVVAGFALPVGLLGWLLARRLGRPVLPRWRAWSEPWTGFDILFLFLLSMLLPTVLGYGLSAVGFFEWVYGAGFPSADGPPDPLGAVGGGAGGAAAAASAVYLRALWGGVFAVPVLVAVGTAARVVAHKSPPRVAPAHWPGRLALGVAAWAVVSPVVYGIYFLALAAASEVGGETDAHPLTRFGGATGFDAVFFGVVAVVAAPVVEEYVFRGLLVRWAAGRWYRPWLLMAGAVGMAVMPAAGGGSFGPVWFAGGLGVGLYLLQRFGRRLPVRTWSAIYSSAALFAIGHAAWPSPVPLFVLGLALGYLAARTGGIAAPIVLHGLFNAVALVTVLRG